MTDRVKGYIILEMTQKKTSLLIDENLWDEAEKLSHQNEWPLKAIVATALLMFLEADQDNQWSYYRKLADSRLKLMQKQAKAKNGKKQ